jgi:hypothetical protein
MMFVQEDDVFGFKSFDETFQVEDKLQSLEKYSTASPGTRIRKEIPNVLVYYNFFLLGEFNFLLLENGISISSEAKCLSFVPIEISVKIDPDSHELIELLNLKLDSAVYVQFKFSVKDLLDLKNILIPKPTLVKHVVQIENQSVKQEYEQSEKKEYEQSVKEEYQTKLKRLKDKKLKLEQDLKDIDLEIQELLVLNNEENECTLCYDSLVSKMLMPCGHVLCGNCLNKLNDLTCPWDRSKVNLIKEIS